MKRIIKFIIAITLVIGSTSCSKNDTQANDPNVTFLATLNGASEVPANSSTATGNATLIFNTDTKIFSISVTHNVAAATNAHIHKGAVGASGAPVFPFSNFASPMSLTSTALDAAQEADLLANLYYVNIHTADFSGGEIRGQLLKQNRSGGGGY